MADALTRFGKFIELRFEKDGRLVGGFVHTYLLEKVWQAPCLSSALAIVHYNGARMQCLLSHCVCLCHVGTWPWQVRVVSQGPGERSFHAFYQLCNGATDTMRKMCVAGALIEMFTRAHSTLLELKGPVQQPPPLWVVRPTSSTLPPPPRPRPVLT